MDQRDVPRFRLSSGERCELLHVEERWIDDERAELALVETQSGERFHVALEDLLPARAAAATDA